MVVIAVSILTRSGKPLLSRQYVDISRIRIEHLLQAFPKLIAEPGSHTSGGQGKGNNLGNVNPGIGSQSQHTYVETETLRYVYHPIEDLYILLLTSKKSNIVQDLSTLRLLVKLFGDLLMNEKNENGVIEHGFDLVFAMDEVLSQGVRESVTVAEIKKNLEMESHEEKLFELVRQSKEDDAKQEMRRKAAAIRQMHREHKDLGGIGNKAEESAIGTSTMGGNAYEPSLAGVSNVSKTDTKVDKIDSFDNFKSSFDDDKDKKETKGIKLGKSKGLALKKKKAGDDAISHLATEEGITIDNSVFEKSIAKDEGNIGSQTPQIQPLSPRENVELESIESVAITVLADGSVSNFELKGSLAIQCQPNHGLVQVKLSTLDQAKLSNQGYKITPSPKLSKPDFQNDLIKLRDPSRPFPNSKFSLVNWKLKSNNEDDLPLKIVVWPEEIAGKKYNVSVEINLKQHLEGLSNVMVKVPLGRVGIGANNQAVDNRLEILNLENGVYRYNSRKNFLEWEIIEMSLENGTSTGMLEFEIELGEGGVEDFFPVDVSFVSKHTLLPIDVENVEVLGDNGTPTGKPEKYGLVKRIDIESFEIVNE